MVVIQLCTTLWYLQKCISPKWWLSTLLYYVWHTVVSMLYVLRPFPTDHLIFYKLSDAYIITTQGRSVARFHQLFRNTIPVYILVKWECEIFIFFVILHFLIWFDTFFFFCHLTLPYGYTVSHHANTPTLDSGAVPPYGLHSGTVLKPQPR